MALWRSGVILNLNVPFLSKTQYFRFRLQQLFKQALSRRIGEALPIFSPSYILARTYSYLE
jgi:hypothetical protein